MEGTHYKYHAKKTATDVNGVYNLIITILVYFY